MFGNVIVGVDPGLSRCGVAVLRGSAAAPRLVASDVVRTGPDQGVGRRLQMIHAALADLVSARQPTAIAVERVFINAQARTGLGAVQVVGLVQLVGASAGVAVTEYTPSQVKAAVTGVGDADKDQVAFMVQRMLTLNTPPAPADRADAMAVALCHLHQPVHATGGHGSIPSRLQAAMDRVGPGLAPVNRPARRGAS